MHAPLVVSAVTRSYLTTIRKLSQEFGFDTSLSCCGRRRICGTQQVNWTAGFGVAILPALSEYRTSSGTTCCQSMQEYVPTLRRQ